MFCNVLSNQVKLKYLKTFAMNLSFLPVLSPDYSIWNLSEHFLTYIFRLRKWRRSRRWTWLLGQYSWPDSPNSKVSTYFFSERIIFTSNLDVQQHILLLQTTLKLIHVESRLFQRKDLALRVDRRSLVLFHLVNFIISHGKIFSHISVNYSGPSHLFFFVWILNSYGTFAIFVCYFQLIKKMSYVK